MLGDLTYHVDTITNTRNQARTRAAQLPDTDPTRKQLEAMAAALEAIRARIVATREGGGITGEERIREQLGGLYGAVNGYDGRPTQSQLDRMTALAKDLDTVLADFDALIKRDLDTVNAALTQKQLEPIKVLNRTDWEKSQAGN